MTRTTTLLPKVSLVTAGLVILAGLVLPNISFASSPIAISSCQGLQAIGTDSGHPFDGSYVLTKDLDCSAATHSGGALNDSGQGFDPIGNTNIFKGTFDGQYHTISGIYINRPSTNDVGLFGSAFNATIKNLQLVGVDVTGAEDVGGLVGDENTDTIQNVYVDGNVSGSDFAVGTIVGHNDDVVSGVTNITHVYSKGQATLTSNSGYSAAGIIGDNDADAVITQAESATNVPTATLGLEYIGGLVGDSDGHLTVSQSFATGDVGGVNAVDVGGLVGWSDSDTISDSYATGTATGSGSVGGLVGIVNDGTITNSYATGLVTSESSVGGLVADNGATVTNSFWNSSTTQQNDACTSDPTCSGGAVDLSTNQMKTSSPFTNAGWSFTSTWGEDSSVNSGMPYLLWSHSTNSTDPVTNQAAQLVLADGCYANNQTVAAESTNATTDNSFNYPDGMMNFVLGCNQNPGFTTQVTVYFFGVDSSKTYVVRKYNPTTQTYATVSGATVSFETVNGQKFAKVVYSVTDGGPLDADGVANGLIEDPVGLAVSTVNAPNTGYGQPNSSFLPLAVLLLSSTLALGALTRIYIKKEI